MNLRVVIGLRVGQPLLGLTGQLFIQELDLRLDPLNRSSLELGVRDTTVSIKLERVSPINVLEMQQVTLQRSSCFG